MYHELLRAIERIDEPYKSACLRIYVEHGVLFRTVPGSTNNHQAWPGGYWDHVTEVMNIALELYPMLASKRQLPFSLSDALLVLFLHDIEKPWKYDMLPKGRLEIKPALREKPAQHAYRITRLAEYGISLTDDQLNGLKYVEGELADYTSRRRVMGPLAAFCHACDNLSARLWFNYPLAANDPWDGAQRCIPTP